MSTLLLIVFHMPEASFTYVNYAMMRVTIITVSAHSQCWWTLVVAFRIRFLKCIQLARKCENV